MQDRILIVDDREENVFALQNMLEEEGREFIKAFSGNQALKTAFNNDLSLILMDVQMPEMDGFEAAEILKSNPRTAKIPIIFVTAINKDSKYVVKGLQDGAIDYLFKPLDVEVTRAKVATILKMVHQQKELEQKNEELSKLNDEKNNLLGIAAHDLRSPIGNIIFLSDFLAEECEEKKSKEAEEYLSMIKNISRYMLTLINNVLDVSKIESGKLEIKPVVIDLDGFIDKNMTFNNLMAGQKEIKLKKDMQQNGIKIYGDGTYLEQVLNNLVSNAVKFSEPGTVITIGIKQEGDNVLVSVADQGQGIPEEELGRLFKFFSRTTVQSTRGEQGTGLGLAITRKIVEAHGGAINVDSKVGEGSVFTFQLPVYRK